MKRSFTAMVSAAIVAALSPLLSAQWDLRTPAGVPKGADGKVNLTAHAPRQADGKADLSGIWMRTVRTEAPGSAPAGRPPLATFGNVGVGFKEGLPSQPWVADLVKKRANGFDNPDALCLPQGPLQYHLDPQPREIVHTPRRTFIIYESNYGLRTIYTDGRRLPPQGEPQPYWHGYSVGRWEGDAFVVESNNFRGALTGQPGDGWLDGRGDPFTDALRLTERFRRVNFGTLEIDVTVDDPKAYTRPFTVRVEQNIVADGSEMIEFICHENQMFLKMTGRAP
ncbi:MAG: hypothetical protein HW394_1489 [Acidobacteria bacterium]|nr:hypothetical protein [Acidobacteriota bacterium]